MTIVTSNMSVPPLPKRYLSKILSAKPQDLKKNITNGMLSLIKSVDAGGGRFILDDDRIEAT
jgi:hypothetical protein